MPLVLLWDLLVAMYIDYADHGSAFTQRGLQPEPAHRWRGRGEGGYPRKA